MFNIVNLYNIISFLNFIPPLKRLFRNRSLHRSLQLWHRRPFSVIVMT